MSAIDLSSIGIPLTSRRVLQDLAFVEQVLKIPRSKRVNEWLHAFAFDDDDATRAKVELSKLPLPSLVSDAREMIDHVDHFVKTLLLESNALVLCRVQGAPHVVESKEDERLLQCVHGMLGMRGQLRLAMDEAYMREVGATLRPVTIYGFLSVLTLQVLAAFQKVEDLAKKLLMPCIMRYEATRNKIRHAAARGVISGDREALLLESLEAVMKNDTIPEDDKAARISQLAQGLGEGGGGGADVENLAERA